MKTPTRHIVLKTAIGSIALATLGIYAAAVFNPATQPYRTIAPYTIIETDLSKGNTKAFRPWFENGAWQGDVIEYTILANGDRSTDVSVGASDPAHGATNKSARAAFNIAEKASASYWKDGRKIITSTSGTNQVAFLWSSLTTTQRTAVDAATAADTALVAAYDSPILNYVRGDRSKEKSKTGGTLRTRFSLLGDIIGSQPVYVGAPKESYTLEGYPQFKSDKSSRTGLLYVGANDGMVHVFNASTLAEVYAYVPSMLMPTLSKLAKVPYEHTYYVDSTMTAGDAVVGSAWMTALAGGLGAGGKGFFVLNITDPTLSAETSDSGTDKKILREVSGSASYMGHVYGKPTIGLLPDGKWYAVTGNGYGSTSGAPSLVKIPIDPEVSIPTPIAASTDTGINTNNGLSAPALVDTDGDNDADIAYAGDLKGNLWRFNLNTNEAKLIFKAGVDKPITSAPEVASHNSGGYLVYVGTGSLLSSEDEKNKQIQSVYAIWDKNLSCTNNCEVAESSLLEQTLTQATHSKGSLVRVASNNSQNWSTKLGWKVNLIEGERVVGNPQLRGARLQFTTTNPTIQTQGSTKLEGATWLLELNWESGGDNNAVLFDLSENNVLDDADKVTVDGVVKTPVALYLGVGNISQPTIARIIGGTDIAYINGLLLPLPIACVGECPTGFLSGHIDVITDSPKGGTVAPTTGTVRMSDGTDFSTTNDGLGGMVDGYSHGYDKIHGVTYVDYFKLEPRRGKPRMDAVLDSSGTAVKNADPWLNRNTEVFRPSGVGPTFDPNQKFIVVLANDDLTEGGKIQIGCRVWTVKEYATCSDDKTTPNCVKRDGITPQLEAGVTPKNLKDNVNGGGHDANGDGTLVFTLNEILADTGGVCASEGKSPTLRITFNSRSIYDNALHGTHPECVLGKIHYGDTGGKTKPAANRDASLNLHVTPSLEGVNGRYRWRNGALTLQLLAVNADGSAGYVLQPASFLPNDNKLGRIGGTHAKAYTTGTTGSGSNKITTFPADKAANESGLLYESSVFWHYGDLAKLRNDQFPACYGASTYSSDISKEIGPGSTNNQNPTGGLTLGEYNKLIDAVNAEGATLLAQYDAAIIALQTFLRSGGTDEDTLKKLLLDIAKLLANSPALRQYDTLRFYAPGHIPEKHLRDIDKGLLTSGETPNTANDGTPATVDDRSQSLKPLLGPNFIPGRRTWIDLLQQ